MQNVRDLIYAGTLSVLLYVWLIYGVVLNRLCQADKWFLGVLLVIGVVIHVVEGEIRAHYKANRDLF